MIRYDGLQNYNRASNSMTSIVSEWFSRAFGYQNLPNSDSEIDENHFVVEVEDAQTTDFTCAQQISWITIQTMMMAVISQTFIEFTCPEKSLAAALTLAVVVPLSVEWIKYAFNLSGALKKDFNFEPRANFALIVTLLAVALSFHYSHLGKNFSSLGYNSVIIVPGILLKLLADYFETFSCSEISGDDFYADAHNPLLQADDILVNAQNTHVGKWYNPIAMHGLARLPLLFSATNAGGKFFEAMHIPLAEGIEACGLTNFSGMIAFSVLLNEIIGSHLFKYSGQFKEIQPNFISRVLTMCSLAIIFQFANILNKINFENFAAAFAIAFCTDLLAQESGLGSKIDQAAGKIGASLQAKCCKWQPKIGEDDSPPIVSSTAGRYIVV